MTLNTLKRLAYKYRGTRAGNGFQKRILAFSDSDCCLMWECGPYHVTHKFLGELAPHQINAVIKCVDDWFYHKQPSATLWTFNRPAWFGPEKDTYVLERDCGSHTDMMLGLKNILDKFVPEKWPNYRPHMTVEPCFNHIQFQPEHYILNRGDKTIKKWKVLPLRTFERD